MENEPLLAQGDAISIHDTTGVSLGITFMERINRSELANLETIANKTVTNNSPRGLLKIFINRTY